MVTFAIDFQPHPFEQAQIEQVQDDVRNRLAGHRLERVNIISENFPAA